MEAKNVHEVIIPTDDERLARVVKDFGRYWHVRRF